MIFLILACSAYLMGLMGNVYGRYDAREIYWRNDNNIARSLNHKSRHALRLAAAGALAAGGVALAGFPLLLFFALWLFNASVFFLVFVPVLNKYRGKARHYVSNSNGYDSFFIRHWQGEAGKVAYIFQAARAFRQRPKKESPT